MIMTTLQTKFTLIILLAILLMCSCANSFSKISLPDGWIAPAKSLTNDDWRNINCGRYLTVEGDFNGDGIVDEARLLVRIDGSEMGLLAFISGNERQHTVFVIDKKSDIKNLKSLGIEVVHSGLYETACAKGFAECREGEPHELILHHDAINYFKHGSANMYFYWDETAHSFKGIGIND